MPISIIKENITRLKVDVIVNAANNQLTPGGGVCGAIFEAAGPELIKACKKIGYCETGNAIITKGFDLPATYIIHTVGPVWRDGKHDESRLLACCYRHSLQLAREHHLHSIAFPAISCGIFGYPVEEAVQIAVSTVSDFLKKQILDVHFVCFDAQMEALYTKAIDG